ncbi:MAG: hypothetical protein R3C39_00155 [Dehalococcoidia bacterium]
MADELTGAPERAVRGILRQVWFDRLPVSRDNLNVVFIMEIDAEDAGQQVEFFLRTVSPDGQETETAHHSTTLPEYRRAMQDWTPVFQHGPATLPQSGTYEFRLIVEGSVRAVAKLELVPRGRVENG